MNQILIVATIAATTLLGAVQARQPSACIRFENPDARPQPLYEGFVNMAWKVEAINECGSAREVYIEVSFLDSEGFPITMTNEITTLHLDTTTVRGLRMMETGAANRVKSIEVTGRMY